MLPISLYMSLHYMLLHFFPCLLLGHDNYTILPLGFPLHWKYLLDLFLANFITSLIIFYIKLANEIT